MMPTVNQIIESPALLNHDGNWSFVDWHCLDRSLEKKAKALMPKIKFLLKLGLIDGDKDCIEFRNVAPVLGTDYDAIIIRRIGERNFYLSLVASCGHRATTGEASVKWYGENIDSEIVDSSWGRLKANLKKEYLK